jgi:hypothetical protein
LASTSIATLLSEDVEGRLHLHVPNGFSLNVNQYSRALYRLQGSTFTFQIGPTPTSGKASVVVIHPDGTRTGFNFTGQRVMPIFSSLDTISINLGAGLAPFWRMRETGAQLLMEYSYDAVSWQPLVSNTVYGDTSAVRVEIGLLVDGTSGPYDFYVSRVGPL